MPFQLLFDTFSKRTDYAAHTGGLVIGLAIGALLAWSLRGSPLEHAARQRRALAGMTFTLALSFGVVIAIRHNIVTHHRQRSEVNDFLVAAQKEAISKNPKDAAAHEKLAKLYFLQSEYDEAANELRRALEIKPGDPDALSQLAFTYGRWVVPMTPSHFSGQISLRDVRPLINTHHFHSSWSRTAT